MVIIISKVIGGIVSGALCACYALTAPFPCFADVTIPDQAVELYIENMYAKRALLQESGSEDALLEYYNNQSVSDENKRELSVVAQAIDLFTDGILGEYYQKFVNGLLDIPESGVSTQVIDDQYTNFTGFYRTETGGDLKCAKFTPTADGVICSAPDFTAKIKFEFVGFHETGREFDTSSLYQYHSGIYDIGGAFSYGSNPSGNTSTCYVYVIKTFTGIFSAYSGRQNLRNVPSSSGSSSGQFICRLSTGTSVPVIGTNAANFFSSAPSTVAAWGKIVNVPDGILTKKPWEYYNTSFLPWVKNECENLGFDYRLITPYPDGYTPPIDPTEPGQAPTIPVSTIPYNPFYEVATETHTEIIEVTDESGDIIGTEIEVQVEGVTDAEGAEEYQYEFKIPELPHFKIPDIQVPTDFSIGENLANVCGSIWSTIYNFLDESGFLAVVIPALTIGLLLFILRYLGG